MADYATSRNTRYEAQIKLHLLLIAKGFLVILLVSGACSSSDTPSDSKMPAKVLLDQFMESRPIVCDHKEIDGDLDLATSGLPMENISLGGNVSYRKVINSTIIITNSTINGDINLDAIAFKQPLNFKDCILLGEIHLEDARFLNYCSFEGSIFESPADLTGCYFYKNVYFVNCTFDGEGIFSGSTYSKKAYFDSAKFKEAHFQDARFLDDAIFGKAIFAGYTTFENSTFQKVASFNQVQFLDKAYILRSRFEGKTNFQSAEFHDTATFTESKFNNISFNGARFIGSAQFLNTTFKGMVRFLGASFEKDALFYRANFSSSLVNLDGCSFDRLGLHWNAISGHLIKTQNYEAVYNKLIENYKNLVWLTDVNECYFDLRHWQQFNKPITDITKPADLFLEWYCGYGTRPVQALLWIILIILVFGFSYWKKDGIYLAGQPDLSCEKVVLTAKRLSDDSFIIEYTPPSPKKERSLYKSLWTALYFSFLVFTSRDTGDIQTEDHISQLVAWERRLGIVLFTIFTYYVGQLVISYFTPNP